MSVIFYQNNFALLISIILFIIFYIYLISYQNLNNLEFEITERILPSNKLIKLNYILKNKTNRERLNINFKQNDQTINLDPKK